MNELARKSLRSGIRNLSWHRFEVELLPRILETLGFLSVEITQPTRDGGRDAICRYRRGVVESEAFVSPKHWLNEVPVEEVRRLRGMEGNIDTAIIVTSSTFSAEVVKEAASGRNQRSIVLVNGDLIVDTCMSQEIGVAPVPLPRLYEFVGFEQADAGEATAESASGDQG